MGVASNLSLGESVVIQLLLWLPVENIKFIFSVFR